MNGDSDRICVPAPLHTSPPPVTMLANAIAVFDSTERVSSPARILQQHAITSHAFDRQERLIVTVEQDMTLRVWDLTTSLELARQALVRIPTEVAFSPNNSRLLLQYGGTRPPYELELRAWQVDELLALASSRLSSEALDSVDRQLRGERRIFAKDR